MENEEKRTELEENEKKAKVEEEKQLDREVLDMKRRFQYARAEALKKKQDVSKVKASTNQSPG